MTALTPAGHVSWGYADAPRQAARLAAEWTAESRLMARRVLEARSHAGDSRLGAPTRQRLQLVADATEHNLNAVDQLLRPVLDISKSGHAAPAGDPAAHGDGETKPRRHASEALPYLFRDWIWGAEEVRAPLATIAEALARLDPRSRGVVLGGGGMRLPWELAQLPGAAQVTAVERNPVLCLAMERLLAGARLDLYEIPREPRSADCVAIRHGLSLPAAPQRAAPLSLVLGDVRAWSPEQPLDWLLTPFVLDVAGADALTLIERWTAWLRPGGCWINAGPLSFRRPWAVDAYTLDEILDALPARGLSIERVELFDVPHLSSPYDARWQRFRGAITIARKRE